jgi:monolysocardiolipin acyltransferase
MQEHVAAGQIAGPIDIPDPFTDPTYTYTTTGSDIFPAPSAYSTRRHSWVHIFPEGKVHQHPDRTMRYFKWGVARLILESDPCPTVVPIWIEGFDQVMHEAREFPRFLPRLGKKIDVVFGDPVSETVWAGFRERWRRLKAKEMKRDGVSPADDFEFMNEELRNGSEARNLRAEVAFVMRDQILKLRKGRGLPDEDPKAGLIDTYREEGGKKEGKMDDESWTKDT